jgi:plastocyanin
MSGPLRGRGALLAAVACATLSACGADDSMADGADMGREMSMAGSESNGSGSAGSPSSGDEPAALNGCTAAEYEDLSAGDAERVIEIAAAGLSFTPPCMTIAAGQTVRFEGSLSAHPLAPGNADDHAAGSPNNPIVATSSGNSAEFTFDAPGTFAYFCELHSFGAGMGMAGAIHVE